MASNPQHEPTMEEILASIRKIISEDSNEAEARADAPSAHAANEADVLELTREDVVEEVQARVEPAHVEEPVRVMQMPSRHDDNVAFQRVEESPVSAPNQAASNDVHSEAHEGFFSESTRKAMHDTFAQLDAGHD